MLTEKQRRFADYFIETGNATEAARRAGYKAKTARQTGAENLTKPYISAYIKERLGAMSSERIADAQEVLEFFSRIMRGQEIEPGGSPATLTVRTNAALAILKRIERIEDRTTAADTLQKAREILGNVESII